MEKEDINIKNMLSLAYLGDAVFTLYVREYLVRHTNIKLNALNSKANKIVCAKSQAELLNLIKPELTDVELDIIRRTRNSHLNSIAKHSTLAEYSQATQFEAIFGYWYLMDEKSRLDEIFNKYVKNKLM